MTAVASRRSQLPLSPLSLASSSTLSTAPPDVDIVSTILGNFGIFQLRTVLIIFLCKIPTAWFMACIIFTAPELYAGDEFVCDANTLSANQTVSIDQCYAVQEKANTDGAAGVVERVRCNSFIYNFNFYSVVMQFDLVCIWGSFYVAWTQYWHLFGVLVGGVIATKLMLRYSPRNVFIMGMIAQIFCGLLTGFARDFSLHCAGRWLSAICCSTMFTAGQAIFVDLTGGMYRIGAIILYDTFWSIGVISLPLISSCFNHWTHIYLGITLPTFVLLLLLQWTPDAPRWLLRNAKDDDDLRHVEVIIRKAAHINERTFKIPDDLKRHLQELSNTLKAAPPSANWLELWRGHRAKTHMLAAHLAMAFFIINFMGMVLNIRSYSRDYLMINIVLLGFSEIVGCFTALYLTLHHNKCKWQYAGAFNIIAGLVGCLGWLFSGIEINNTVKVILWMIIATIPKAGVSCAQSMLLACMNELMPANKKQPFVFSVVTWARFWLFPAPFLNILKIYDTALSLTAYSVLSIFGGICTCFIRTPMNFQAMVIAPRQQTTNGETTSVTPSIWTIDDEVHNTRL